MQATVARPHRVARSAIRSVFPLELEKFLKQKMRVDVLENLLTSGNPLEFHTIPKQFSFLSAKQLSENFNFQSGSFTENLQNIEAMLLCRC